MEYRYYLFIFLILLTLSACDPLLQEDTQKALSKQSRLTPTPPPGESREKEVEETKSSCPEEDPHPMAASISNKYDTPYQEVIKWYCDGYKFEDILLALQTSKMSEAEPGDLLEQTESTTWEEIWEELGITNPKN